MIEQHIQMNQGRLLRRFLDLLERGVPLNNLCGFDQPFQTRDVL